ncbi:ankyrin repeat domain-containing protein [Altererythrobacter salegens]|uniref:Ankyrin repeat domain-containing protein n=1 Tax=Croceibacterium salegens TaxID=1737568 RepID=A0A6I4SW11_9SPHN|nr:ankyrin repeat domain-containing protein [Croceibacterium salegens]
MVHRIRRAGLAILLAMGFALVAAPATAQLYSDGYKFLQAVEKKDRDAVINLFNKNQTIIDSRDLAKGHTGLHITIERRDLAWTDYLLGLNANPNIADKQGVTPLMLAAQMGYVEGVQLLARKGARVDVANSTGETPLMSAVHRRDIALLRVLLRAGADPNRIDNSGRSARDYAALDGGNNILLNEIDRLAKSGDELEKPAKVYGPSF